MTTPTIKGKTLQQLQVRTIYSGKHKGIFFEIHRFEKEWLNHTGWTYYLQINLAMIPDKYQTFWLEPNDTEGSRVYYPYYDHPIIGRIDFHGGITWYGKKAGFDGDKKIIEIGCDYQHSFDEGIDYSVDEILEDVKKSIESLLEMIPDIKIRDDWNHKYYDKKDGQYVQGRFYSKETLEKEPQLLNKDS